MGSSQSSSPPPRYETGQYFKRLYSGKEKRENYEILFQKNFTLNHPWGKTPDEEEDREPTSQSVKDLLPKLRNISVPIHTLSHVTHDDEAESIENEIDDEYHFETRSKCGKDFENGCGYRSWIPKDDSENESEVQVSEQSASEGSDREYQYKEDELLPGFYSWWGIRLSESDRILALPETERDAIRDLKKERVYVPNYISRIQSSNYGNNCFYSSYEDALESYATSRETATSISQLCLKVGGTLRYRHEICHVVIVCRKDDTALSSYATIPDDTALSSYAPITLARVRKLVDGSEKVKNEDYYFQPQCVVTKINDKNVSYEQLAFAFYFPEKSFLRCRKGSVQRCSIKHTEKQCTKTIPIPGKPEQKWKCPNKIETKRLQPTLSDFLQAMTIPGERLPSKQKPKKRLQRTHPPQFPT